MTGPERVTPSWDPPVTVAQVGITDVDDDPPFFRALGSEVIEKVRDHQIGPYRPLLVIDLEGPVISDAVIETVNIGPGDIPTDPSRRIGVQHHNRLTIVRDIEQHGIVQWIGLVGRDDVGLIRHRSRINPYSLDVTLAAHEKHSETQNDQQTYDVTHGIHHP